MANTLQPVPHKSSLLAKAKQTFDRAKDTLPPWMALLGGIAWSAITARERRDALDTVLEQPYLAPLLLVAFGLIWLRYVNTRPPKLAIECDPSHHPFRQEWDDRGGRQILFRVAVKNLSHRVAVNRAEVKVTASDTYIMACLPARLILMNERQHVREFFLPPGGTQYVDVLQQSQPSGELRLWHAVRNQERLIAPGNYTLTITVYGDNTTEVSRNFKIVREGSVFSLKSA